MATHMDSLVGAAWLAQQLGADDLVVLDASQHLPGAKRDARAEFTAAHIPGARFLDLATLIDPASDIANAVPKAAQFAARMSALGIRPDWRILLYDDSKLRSAARAWFVFRMMGVVRCAILDGGLEAWRSEGRPLEAGLQPCEPSDYLAPQASVTRLRTKAQVLANCQSREEQLVDARDVARFTGETADAVHGLPGGHIPGARHLFFRDVLDDAGRFRPVDELTELFRRTGVDPDRPIVTSCGSGMSASVLLFALHLIGKQDTALYDGSWSEWGSDPAMPRETGEAA